MLFRSFLIELAESADLRLKGRDFQRETRHNLREPVP